MNERCQVGEGERPIVPKELHLQDRGSHLRFPPNEYDNAQKSRQDKPYALYRRQLRKTIHDKKKNDTVKSRTGQIEFLFFGLAPFPFQFPEDERNDDQSHKHIDEKNTPP